MQKVQATQTDLIDLFGLL